MIFETTPLGSDVVTSERPIGPDRRNVLAGMITLAGSALAPAALAATTSLAQRTVPNPPVAVSSCTPRPMVVDAQLHEPPINLEWGEANQLAKWKLLTEVQIAYMDAAGVDLAILHPVDPGWGSYAVENHPDRFAIVPMVDVRFGGIDPRSPRIRELVAEKKRTVGVVGMRIVRLDVTTSPVEPYRPLLEACENENLPIFLYTTGDVAAAGKMAEWCPKLKIVIDHIGLPQPPWQKQEDPPLKSLRTIFELAKYSNIAIKLSGAPSLSNMAYPYPDLWALLLRPLIAAYGPERLMWGSDISRFLGKRAFDDRKVPPPGSRAPHTYAEALFHLREADQLSCAEKTWILGESARKILDWPRHPAGGYRSGLLGSEGGTEPDSIYPSPTRLR